MKKFILPLIITLLLSACEKDKLNDLSFKSTSEEFLKAGNQVAVCHKSGDNWHVINININAWPAHEAHGDAIDMDGDGYFDRECGCSEVDCNDEDQDVNTDCGNQSEGPLTIMIGNSPLYIHPTDNSTGTRYDGAKQLCDNLVVFGYDDWYLPSKEELNAMHLELDAGVMIGTYWSSTSQGMFDAWYQDFNTGTQSLGSVFDVNQCRCVRK